MELSFKVSEAQYLRAWRLRNKSRSMPRAKLIGLCAFIVAIVVGVTIGVVYFWQRLAPAPVKPGLSGIAIVGNSLPLIVLIGSWVSLAAAFGAMNARRQYRHDPSMQAEFTANLTQESVSFQSTAGVSLESGWNIYESWREGKDVAILILTSGTYLILGLSGINEEQRAELRNILNMALPEKSASENGLLVSRS
jgi:ABC-type dipeptide/oligopeptide/nickel transport system permease component